MQFLPLILAVVAVVALLGFTGRAVKIKNITNDLRRGGSWPVRSLGSLKDITIHHSAGPITQTAADFARYHVDTKGWPGIGYHFVIGADGRIFQTNNVNSASWHNGYNNSVAVGVCLVGDFTKHSPTNAQITACENLCKMLKGRYKSITHLVGHKEYSNSTLCPGSYPVVNLRKKLGLAAHGGTKIGFAASFYDASKADN